MVSREAVLDVLRTINDPEMPINIVDLGIIEAVRIEPAKQAARASARIEIDVLPTFVGCPALPVIEQEIRKRVATLDGVDQVDVHMRFDPPWTVERISAAGRETLRQFGVTVPLPNDQANATSAAPRCPLCGSSAVTLESAFGPTRCRMIYYCESCRNPFEHMKKVEASPSMINIGIKKET